MVPDEHDHPQPKRVRYFFDASSGVCLWAANDEARRAHGEAIDADALPLTDNTRAWLERLRRELPPPAYEWIDEACA